MVLQAGHLYRDCALWPKFLLTKNDSERKKVCSKHIYEFLTRKPSSTKSFFPREIGEKNIFSNRALAEAILEALKCL